MSYWFSNIKSFIKKEFIPIIIYTVIFVCSVLLYKYKMMNLFIDFGREVSVPYAIINGEVLYKDIFNLYAPLSYLFNAFILKLFNQNLQTFISTGIVCTYLILCGLYVICRKFLNKIISCLIVISVISVCAFVPQVTNYITPYSYAMIFGLCFTIYSIILTFKFLDFDKNIYLYSAFLFSGIAFANKFEFIFLLFPLIYLCVKKNCFKNIWLCCLIWLLPTAVSYFILILQGLSVSDYLKYMDIMLRYVHTPSFQKFYDGTMTFSVKYMFTEIAMFAIAAVMFKIIFWITKFSIKLKQQWLYYLCVFCLCLVFMSIPVFSTVMIFSFFPLLLLILFIYKYKYIKNDLKLVFLILMALSLSVKSIFMLNTVQYGRYFLPLLSISIIILLINYYFIDFKKVTKKTISVFLISLVVSNLWINYCTFKNYNAIINTGKGKIITTETNRVIFETILNYLKSNTEKNKKVVVLRESSIINFLAQRKSDNFYNHLDRVSFDALGEDKILAHYSKNKPDIFIVFVHKHNPDAFAIGYAKKTIEWINNNYKLEKHIKTQPEVYIFKKI